VAVGAPTASAADTSAPSQPGTVTVSGVTATSASLAWGRSTDDVGIEGYRVYRGPAGAADTALNLIATTDAVTSYAATKLYSGRAYKFGVVAIDAADNASAMRTATLTTSGSTDATAPAAPSSSSVSAKAFSSSRIDVVWGTSGSTDVSGYRVLRDGAVVGTVDLPNGLRYSDNGLAAGSTHTYAVVAVDHNGNVSAATSGRSVKTLAAGTVQIARGPYLSNVTGTSAVISWWTNLPTSGVVSWGVASATEHSTSDPAGGAQHHRVSIGGLSPGTTYAYQVGNGAGVTSGATFRTAAPAGQTFKFAAIGDFGGGSAGETQNATNIAGAGTSFIQTVGDNIYPSSGLPDPNFTTTYSDFDGRFFKQFASAVKAQAFFPANGNKEYYSDGEFWNAFPMPGSNHAWYSYDWGDAHVLVLDSEQPYAPGTPQYAFAQADLAAHQAAAWRIVAVQRPPYSSSSANSSSKPVQQYLVPLFQAQHVDLVLSGNSHNYERTNPLTDGAPAAGGVTYVVTGAGGNGFNAFSLAQPAWSAFREASYYEYERVTVSPSSLQLDAVRADTGAVFDSATITKSATTPAPAPPSGLRATATSPSAIGLAWTASPSAGVTYRIRRGGAKIADVPGTQTSYSDTGLTASTTYSYTVAAVASDGTTESAPTGPASATTDGTGSGGTTTTLAPSADATISSATPTTNAGSGTRLTVDSPGVDFLLRFDLPSSCSSVSKALLTLTVGGSTNNNSVKGGDFYRAPDNGWTESDVTWNSAPAATGSPVSLGAVSLSTAYTVDVTSLVSAPGSVSIRASTTSGDAAAYLSKEASATTRPQLEVTC
jgi:fibronectin type 3 domain-containing protein